MRHPSALNLRRSAAAVTAIFFSGTLAQAQTTAVTANDFLNSIGVCTHVSQGIDNANAVASCLTYAGFRNFRDDPAANSTVIQKFITINSLSGAKACILPKNGNLTETIAMYEQLASANVLMAIEGPNEPNNWPVTYQGQYSGGSLMTTSSAATINYSVKYNTSYVDEVNAGFGKRCHGPLSFKYGSSTPFVTSTRLGVRRNDYTGWIGCKFRVGSTPITVTELARWVVAGNTQAHAVRLVRASDQAILGTVSVATSGAPAGFKYSALTTPVTLAANTTYYIMSQETSGGDQWCEGVYNSLPIAWFQRDLYAAVRAHPVLSNYPVFGSSSAGGSQPNNCGLQYLTIPTPLPAGVLMPAGTQYADYANVHNYVCGQLGAVIDNNAWNPFGTSGLSGFDTLWSNYGHTWWTPRLHGYDSAAIQTIPRVSTETGWKTQGTNSISETAQAKLFLNLYLSAYKRGWAHTFIYMLRDDPNQGYWGLFKTDYSPKLSATYLRNMTSILADSIDHTPGALTYSIASQPATVHDLLIQKSNGQFHLAVWNERASGSDTVTINLGSTFTTVKVYDPTIGTTPTLTLSSVNSVTVSLSDHPVIIEPVGSQGSAPIIQATFTSTGSQQYLSGTKISLAADLPGGNWIWGGGWNWAAPYVTATWDTTNPQNCVNLVDEKNALGVSLASSGSYVKPTRIRVSAKLAVLTSFANGGGLGFWSAMPARTDGVSALAGFSGLNLRSNGTLQLYVNGTAVGAAVSVGAISNKTFYPLAYNIDTATGAISSINFNGVPVSGISGAGFTNSATSYTGVLSSVGARAFAKDITVTSW